MSSGNKNWILVQGSDAATIQNAIIEHSGLTAHEQPQAHRVSIFEMGAGKFAVTFDPPAPPYVHTNLICWLDDPRMCQGVEWAVGWLVAPGDGMRYFLAQDHDNPLGDTLIGGAANGVRISVYLPDCSVRRTVAPVEMVAEPEWPTEEAEPVVTFEVTLDVDTSFGNPDFVIG